MKKAIFTLAAFIFAATVFTGCNKDEDEGSAVTINATVDDGASYNSSIDEVKAVISHGDTVIFVVASGSYTNGGFSLTLPKSIDGKHLEPMDTDIPEGVTTSNLQVKGCGINFYGYKSGEVVGMFQNGKNDDVTYTAAESYIFVDGNTSISGSSSETSDLMGMPITIKTSYNLTLKKGWNLVYFNMTPVLSETEISMTMDISNTPITGLKWYYTESYFSDLSVQKKMVELSKLKMQMLF